MTARAGGWGGVAGKKCGDGNRPAGAHNGLPSPSQYLTPPKLGGRCRASNAVAIFD